MLNKRAFYGNDWGVPSAEHPAGECLNRSAPGIEDGSYFEKSWVNDLMALPGALMSSAGLTPNGTEDTATACQVFDALVNGRWSVIANYTVGTIVTASNGKQYYCNIDNGRDSATVDPVSDNLDNWREYPAKTTTTADYHVVEYFDGRVDISFLGSTSGSNGVSVCTIPMGITLKDSRYQPQLTEITSEPASQSVGNFGVVLNSKSQTSFDAICVDSSGNPRSSENPYVRISYIKA